MEITPESGQTFAGMVLYATEHPISPVMPPTSFAEYSHNVGLEHMLLVVAEVQAGERLIHASLAQQSARLLPALSVTLAVLAPLQQLLGVAIRWGIYENVVHWHWPQERASGLRSTLQ